MISNDRARQRKSPVFHRAAGWTRFNQPCMLEVELFTFTWLARAAMIAAVASNYDKAKWVISQFSEGGSWSPIALALGLEISFAVSAYFLAARIQNKRSRGDVWLIAFVTFVFAAISVVANIGYFIGHAGIAPKGWEMVEAIALGVAAPLVALSNAVLSGELAGIAAEAQAQQAEDDARKDAQAADAQALAAQRAHEVELSRLALDRAREETSQERARSRQAQKALELVQARDTSQPTSVHSGRDSGHPVLSREGGTGQTAALSGPSLTGQDARTRQAIMDAILSILSDRQDVTVRELADLVGRGKTTVNTYLADLATAGLVEQTPGGQYVIAGRNGHHAPGLQD